MANINRTVQGEEIAAVDIGYTEDGYAISEEISAYSDNVQLMDYNGSTSDDGKLTEVGTDYGRKNLNEFIKEIEPHYSSEALIIGDSGVLSTEGKTPTGSASIGIGTTAAGEGCVAEGNSSLAGGLTSTIDRKTSRIDAGTSTETFNSPIAINLTQGTDDSSWLEIVNCIGDPEYKYKLSYNEDMAIDKRTQSVATVSATRTGTASGSTPVYTLTVTISYVGTLYQANNTSTATYSSIGDITDYIESYNFPITKNISLAGRIVPSTMTEETDSEADWTDTDYFIPLISGNTRVTQYATRGIYSIIFETENLSANYFYKMTGQSVPSVIGNTTTVDSNSCILDYFVYEYSPAADDYSNLASTINSRFNWEEGKDEKEVTFSFYNNGLIAKTISSVSIKVSDSSYKIYNFSDEMYGSIYDKMVITGPTYTTVTTTTSYPNAYNHAEGYKATALGQGAHAEGYQTIATGEAGHAAGHYTSSYGYASVADGYKTVAIGNESRSIGSGTSAYTYHGIAEGRDNLVGYMTTASSSFTGSITSAEAPELYDSYKVLSDLGLNMTVVVRRGNQAIPYETTIDGNYLDLSGFAVTDFNDTTGIYYICPAYQLGQNSHVGGYASTVQRDNTLVFGRGLLSKQHDTSEYPNGYPSGGAVFGRYNNNTDDSLLEIGNGSNDNNRSNILTVTSDTVSIDGALKLRTKESKIVQLGYTEDGTKYFPGTMTIVRSGDLCTATIWIKQNTLYNLQNGDSIRIGTIPDDNDSYYPANTDLYMTIPSNKANAEPLTLKITRGKGGSTKGIYVINETTEPKAYIPNLVYRHTFSYFCNDYNN